MNHSLANHRLLIHRIIHYYLHHVDLFILHPPLASAAVFSMAPLPLPPGPPLLHFFHRRRRYALTGRPPLWLQRCRCCELCTSSEGIIRSGSAFGPSLPPRPASLFPSACRLRADRRLETVWYSICLCVCSGSCHPQIMPWQERVWLWPALTIASSNYLSLASNV